MGKYYFVDITLQFPTDDEKHSIYANAYLKEFLKDNNLVQNITYDGTKQTIQFANNEDLVLFKLLYLSDLQELDYKFNKIDNPSEEFQLAGIKYFPKYIKWIDNPSENVQLTAIELDPDVIQYIKKPTENVQLLTVKKNPLLIGYLKNPSENIQLEAIMQDFTAIYYIKNPTEKIIKLFDESRENIYIKIKRENFEIPR
jgi:hypothetical protein